MDDMDNKAAPRAGRRARQGQLMQEQAFETSMQGNNNNGTQQDAFQSQTMAFNSPSGNLANTQPQQQDNNSLTPPYERDSASRQSLGVSKPRQGFTETSITSPKAVPPSTADIIAGDPDKKFTGVSRRKQVQEVAEKQEQAKARSKYDEMVSEAVDIPELEEEGKEDLSTVVAAAPKVRANKIQALEELDQDAAQNLPGMQDRDIDLSILTAVLCSSEMVFEDPNEVWNYDLLLSQVAAEFNADKDKPLEKRDSILQPEMTV